MASDQIKQEAAYAALSMSVVEGLAHYKVLRADAEEVLATADRVMRAAYDRDDNDAMQAADALKNRGYAARDDADIWFKAFSSALPVHSHSVADAES